METGLKEAIAKQAQEEGISMCELCRRKLKEPSRIIKIENMVGKILFLLENRKIYKEAYINNSSKDKR